MTKWRGLSTSPVPCGRLRVVESQGTIKKLGRLAERASPGALGGFEFLSYGTEADDAVERLAVAGAAGF